MKKRTPLIIIGALLVIGLIAFASIRWMNREETVSVRGGRVTTDTIHQTAVLSGTLIPNRTTNFYGTGLVTEVVATTGQAVNENEQLAEYENGLQLTADFSGTITEVNIQKGQPDTSAQRSQPSLVLDDLSTLKVQLALSSSEAQDIQVDQSAVIEADDQTFEGRVSRKDPAATANQSMTTTTDTASLQAIVSFNEPPEKLYAGFDAQVTITTATATDVLTLPIEALTYNEEDQPVVYMIQDNQTRKTRVELGIQSDTRVEIKSGLAENDQVVLSPSSDLTNTTQVTVE